MQENNSLKLSQISNNVLLTFLELPSISLFLNYMKTCCSIKTGVEKNELHLNIDENVDHQMSLCESKCWYSYTILHF